MLAWLVPEDHPGGTVYGVILVGSLLAAESDLHDSYAATIGSTLLAAALYWLSHAYSTLLGRRLADGRRLVLSSLLAALVRDWALMRGAILPVLALALAWIAGASRETGVTVAVWSAIACLASFELIAGLRSNAGRRELVIELGVGLCMGAGILGLRTILH